MKPTLPNTRKTLRQHYKAQRKALSKSEQELASSLIARQLFTLKPVSDAKSIGVFLSFSGEIDISGFINQCWVKQKTTVLPVLHPSKEGFLLFQTYHEQTEMGLNRYNIVEPQRDCTQTKALEKLDVLVMPLVAFDKHKNRLGMGGGYYDRTLGNHQQNGGLPTLIGVAHDCQYHHNTLPVESWDIPLDYVVTPRLII